MPLLGAVVVFGAWFVGRYPRPWSGVLAVEIATGGVGGFCIHLGHELGHKPGASERCGPG